MFERHGGLAPEIGAFTAEFVDEIKTSGQSERIAEHHAGDVEQGAGSGRDAVGGEHGGGCCERDCDDCGATNEIKQCKKRKPSEFGDGVEIGNVTVDVNRRRKHLFKNYNFSGAGSRQHQDRLQHVKAGQCGN